MDCGSPEAAKALLFSKGADKMITALKYGGAKRRSVKNGRQTKMYLYCG